MSKKKKFNEAGRELGNSRQPFPASSNVKHGRTVRSASVRSKC